MGTIEWTNWTLECEGSRNQKRERVCSNTIRSMAKGYKLSCLAIKILLGKEKEFKKKKQLNTKKGGVWNIKHLAYAILKTQSKIKIIYTFWQFLLSKKPCCHSLALTLPGGCCSKNLGDATYPSLSTRHASHSTGHVPVTVQVLLCFGVFWGNRECPLLREGGQGSREEAMKWIRGKWTLERDVILLSEMWPSSSEMWPSCLEHTFWCQKSPWFLCIFFLRGFLYLRGPVLPSSSRITWELNRNAHFSSPIPDLLNRKRILSEARHLCWEDYMNIQVWERVLCLLVQVILITHPPRWPRSVLGLSPTCSFLILKTTF